MKNKDFITIIITTFNSLKSIKKTIKSVLDQKYQNFEIILVDDCSNDGTYEYLKKMQKKFANKIILLKTKKNSGTPSVSRNLGIKNAKGKFICFLDSDDTWEKNKLQLQVEAFSDENMIYTTAAKYFNAQNLKSNFLINFIRVVLQKFFINKINTNGFQWFYIYNPIITSSILVHKNIFKNFLFDEDKNIREDIDMWIRLREGNYRFYLTQNIVTNIFRRNDSLTSNYKKELITLIRSLSNVYLKMNTFSKLNYFLLGIILKFSLAFIRINKKIIKSLFKKTLLVLASLYFVVFYTPLFWYLGKPLLHHDETETFKDYKNIVIFSGHGNVEYYNTTYLYRYKDIINFSPYGDTLDNIFLLGRLQHIPEQVIIQKMLIADGFDDKKLNIIYKEYNNTRENIVNISSKLKEKNIYKTIFITSPYHSKRAKLLWLKNSNINVKILKSDNWPKKNKFFQYSKNKKIILYEYVSLAYNKIVGNL